MTMAQAVVNHPARFGAKKLLRASCGALSGALLWRHRKPCATGPVASATPEGQSSIRVSGPWFVMGQAAGTAANLALQSNKAPRSISIADLQNKLSMDGVFFGN